MPFSHSFSDRRATTIAARIETDCGFSAPVLMRSAAQISAVAREHPFAEREDDPKRLHVFE